MLFLRLCTGNEGNASAYYSKKHTMLLCLYYHTRYSIFLVVVLSVVLLFCMVVCCVVFCDVVLVVVLVCCVVLCSAILLLGVY